MRLDMITHYIFILGLSVAGIAVLFGVIGPTAIVIFFVIVTNILQAKKPNWLPSVLRNWDFLPLWMHSLDPIDRVRRIFIQSGQLQYYLTKSFKTYITIKIGNVLTLFLGNK